MAITHTGDISVYGPCISASDGTPCDRPPAPVRAHADIADGSARSTVLMANLFYAPLEARGSNSRFQPFLVGGIGFSRNTVESWTRFNLDAGTPPGSGPATRVFGSNTETDFAWSIGLGASWQLTRAGQRPVLLDVSWRYYDFGEAVGGSVADVGVSTPRQPLTFDLDGHVFSVGLRIPLQRL
jgi:opacity protein-like surface antigen